MLATYELLEKLGEGGMGVVYKARDTRLHRPVPSNSWPPATVNVLPANPQWFTYSVGSATWIAGLIANTSTLIAPMSIFGANCCRAPKTGDYIELFANGLGPTSPAAPAGVVLTAAYPIPDLSQVKVTIGGRDAPVIFAGLVGAGLYQVNIFVPSGIGSGDLPVVMTISGQTTKTATLNFQ